MTTNYEALIIGGGAVGMSAAYHLSEAGVDVAVLEKEAMPAMHQSGRNSGVIHAGYNPKPGSLKAQYCIDGNRELRAYCTERNIPVREGGIMILAQDDQDMEVVKELKRRGDANGAQVCILSEDEIKEREPYARGAGALLATEGASFDSHSYVQSLANDSVARGAHIYYGTQVKDIHEEDDGIVVDTNKGPFAGKTVVNAAGIYADKIAEDLSADMRVIPFRGYYAELRPDKLDLVNSHIYATPDLNFPFLGVHLSKRADGRVIVGPGAMLAFGREAYSFTSFKGGGLADTLTWPGFYRMMAKPEFQALIRSEIKKSVSVSAVAHEAMVLVPSLREEDLVKSYAGNRAQMVDRNGNLVDDIVVRETNRSVHVLNAVSPGLTCSLPFGRDLANKVMSKL